MNFKDLKLETPILKALETKGYQTPSKIQEEAIPHVLAGTDVFGCAQTGTGKTAAFALPIIQRLMQEGTPSYQKRPIRALILTPTRELALQIKENLDDYSTHTKITNTVIFGGVSQVPQVEALRRGVDILVATPGRLNDLINQKEISLKQVEIFVLDEADRMLDMGFIHDVKKIIALVPIKRQTLLFSATMPSEIMALTAKILHNPVTVQVTPVSSTVDKIDASLYYVDKANKRSLLAYILKHEDITSTLVFTRTKHGADRVAKFLAKEKITAAAIHGDKSQNARQNALEQFKSGKIRVLVATDIAARGIDIDRLSCVINFDIPNEPETYVHRIGRTGRTGRDGRAISFSDFEEKAYIRDIEKLIKQSIPVVEDHPFPMEIFEVLPKVTQARPTKAERIQRAAEKAAKIAEAKANKAAKTAKTAAQNNNSQRNKPQNNGTQRNKTQNSKAKSSGK